MVFLTINILVLMLGVVDVTGASVLAPGLSLGSAARITCAGFWDGSLEYKYRAGFWYGDFFIRLLTLLFKNLRGWKV